MSLNNLMSIARTAMLTHQAAINVTSHNIANASTPGYTRQRLQLAAAVPLRTPLGDLGRGVLATGVMSYRDALLDAALRREQGGFGHADMLRSALQRVEQIFAEPSDAGIAAALDRFFDSWSDLADSPFSGAARVAVRDAAQQLARRLQDADGRLQGEHADLGARTRDIVSRINQITTQVADLNRQIVAASAGGRSAPDLEDIRGALLDELSGLAGTRVLIRSDRSAAVIVGDALLVEGGFAQQLEVRTSGGAWTAGVVGSTRDLSPGGGELLAILELSGQGIPSVRQELDRLALWLVTTVNGLHSAGTTPGGATGVDFFDPAGLTAGAIRLGAAVALDPQSIVTGATSASGDNAVALQVAALRNGAAPGLNGMTPGEFFASLAVQVAGMVRDADQGAVLAEQVVLSLEGRRAAIGGVSTDEEMVNLIVQQQAFSAATRLVTVADEMMRDLLEMV